MAPNHLGAIHEDEDVEDLAMETVALGLQSFQVALARGKWSPEAGASLRSYFIGSCILQFANVYRKWDLEHRKHRNAQPVDPVELKYAAEVSSANGPRDDPADDVAMRDEVRDILARQDSMTARILASIAEGYSHAETARRLGLSRRAVEGRLYRLRTTYERDR